MNRHNTNANILLVEIMVAILFFSICTVILLRTFVATRNQNLNAAMKTDMLV